MLAVVGNKCDCPAGFNFSTAQQFAREIGATAFKTSAKTGEGVQELFETVAMQLLKRHNEEQKLRGRDNYSSMGSANSSYRQQDDVLYLTEPRDTSKSKCC